MRALEEGAVEVITKPKVGVREFLHESAVTLLDAVWSASQARRRLRPAPSPAARLTADAILPHKSKLGCAPAPWNVSLRWVLRPVEREALRVFLKAMPADCPPIVIVQHSVPEAFVTRAFANRLNSECSITVKEAEHGDRPQSGHAFIACRAIFTCLSNAQTSGLTIQLTDGPLVSRHRPSVDVLFRSIAVSVGSKAVGVIMTGTGDDGAQGLLEMQNKLGPPTSLKTKRAASFSECLAKLSPAGQWTSSSRWRESLQKFFSSICGNPRGIKPESRDRSQREA